MGFQSDVKATRNSDLYRSSEHIHGSALILRVTHVPKLIHSDSEVKKKIISFFVTQDGFMY